MALGSPEHSGRVRGVGAYVNPSSYFNEPVRHDKHVNEIIKETVRQLIEEERTKGHALAKEMVAIERGYWVDKMTQLEDKIERFSKAQGSPIVHNLLIPTTHLSDKGSCSAGKVPDENNVEPKPCNDKNLTLKFAERTLKVAGETINFTMEAEVFGSPRSTHILHEDILQFGEMSKISGTCIVVYMRNHWMLTIVNVDKETIYFIDPLNRIIIDEEWKQVINTAIKVLNVKRNRKGRKTPQWIILMGTPKQPTNTECGYFVMRYMKEIVEDKNLEFASKYPYSMWSKTNEPKIKLMKYGMSGQIM